MIEKSKKNKKGVISEEDISTLLQRYTATTVLALLQEVAQFDGMKIDWNALVKKTTTGISNAREYQMLWRHLAYRHVLPENFDDGAHPLDDDSDLESELEAFPSVNSEASTEASACVKVLIASGLPSHPNSATVEAPLTINIPNGQSFRATSEKSQPAMTRGMNITVPVSVQKLSLPAATFSGGTEVCNANGSGSGTFPPRRKRKPWSHAEDLELISAVQKFGEGNWANIVRGEFKGDRTASQLSQRWSIIRKKQGDSNPGTVSSGPHISEAQRAASQAVKIALNSHPKSSITSYSVGTTSNKASNNGVPPAITMEASPAQLQSQQNPMMTNSSSIWPLGSAAKSQVILKQTSSKTHLSSDRVRAAAVAAGARIATQSDAASLLKAAQVKNAVHIMPTGNFSIKSSMGGGVSTHSEANPEASPNTPFISSGMATAPATTCPAASDPCPGLAKATSPPSQVKASSSTTQHTQSTPIAVLNTLSEQINPGLAKSTSSPHQVKASSSTTQHPPSIPVTSLNMLPEQTNAEIPPKQGMVTVYEQTNAEIPPKQGMVNVDEQTNAEIPPKQGMVTVDDIKVLGPQEVANKQVLKSGAHVAVKEPSEQVQEAKAALTNQETELRSQSTVAESSKASPELTTNERDLAKVTSNHVEGNQIADDNKMTCTPIEEAEKQSTRQENGKNPSAIENQADLRSTVSDDSCKKVEDISKTGGSNGMVDG